MRIMGEAFKRAMSKDREWKEHLARVNEMSRLDVPDDSDALPFRVVVNSPDRNKIPHAHILAFDPNEKELGAFVITDNPPRRAADFVEYKAGPHKGLRDIPVEWLEMIVKWARKRNGTCARRGLSLSNWMALKTLYDFSSKRPPRAR